MILKCIRKSKNNQDSFEDQEGALTSTVRTRLNFDNNTSLLMRHGMSGLLNTPLAILSILGFFLQVIHFWVHSLIRTSEECDR